MRLGMVARYALVALATFLLSDCWLISGFLPDISIQTHWPQWSSNSSTAFKLVSLALLSLAPIYVLVSRTISVDQKLIGSSFVVYIFACAGTILSSARDLMTSAGAWSIATAILIGFSCSLLFGNVRTAFRIVSILMMLVATSTIVTYNSTDYIMWSGSLARAGGPFKRPEIVATLLVLTLPWLLARLYDEGERNPLPSVVKVSLSGAALALTWMRDSFASVGLAFAAMAYRDYRPRLLVPILLVFTVLAGLTSAARSNGEARAVSTAKSNQGHFKAWEKGLEEFAKRPLTGSGVSALVLPIFRQTEAVTAKAGILSEPKSLYIDLLVDIGVCGGLLVIAVAVGLTRHFRANRDPLSNQLLASWIALALLGVFDTVILSDRFASNVFFGLLTGLTLLPPDKSPARQTTDQAIA